MKIRGYRIRVNWGGVRTLVIRLTTVLLVSIIPYAIGRMMAAYTGREPETAGVIPLWAAHYGAGSSLLILVAFVLVVVALILQSVINLVFDVEEVGG